MPFARAVIARCGPYAVSLSLGIVGGAAFSWLDLPLAWMLGAMTAGLLGALLGLPMKGPAPLASPMRAVIGVLLGAAFTPEIVERAPSLLLSLAFLVPYTVLSGVLGMVYLSRVAGFDRPTSFFAAMPGGLADMALFAQIYGGDLRKVGLVHGSRVLLIVLFIPFWIQWTNGVGIDRGLAASVGLADLPLEEVALLALCGAVGWPLAHALRIPGASMVGPMLLSAAVHLLGWSVAQPPDVLVSLAQLVLGTVIGARYAGTGARQVGRVLLVSLGLVVIMLAVTFSICAVVVPLTGRPLDAVFLAFAPGGLAETSLIALALGIEVAYVACHHLARILLVITVAPFVFRVSSRTAPVAANRAGTGRCRGSKSDEPPDEL